MMIDYRVGGWVGGVQKGQNIDYIILEWSLRCALNGQWLTTLMTTLTQWSDIHGHYHDECLLRLGTP